MKFTSGINGILGDVLGTGQNMVQYIIKPIIKQKNTKIKSYEELTSGDPKFSIKKITFENGIYLILKISNRNIKTRGSEGGEYNREFELTHFYSNDRGLIELGPTMKTMNMVFGRIDLNEETNKKEHEGIQIDWSNINQIKTKFQEYARKMKTRLEQANLNNSSYIGEIVFKNGIKITVKKKNSIDHKGIITKINFPSGEKYAPKSKDKIKDILISNYNKKSKSELKKDELNELTIHIICSLIAYLDFGMNLHKLDASKNFLVPVNVKKVLANKVKSNDTYHKFIKEIKENAEDKKWFKMTKSDAMNYIENNYSSIFSFMNSNKLWE